MKLFFRIIFLIFILFSILFSTPLFIQETQIKNYVKNKILEEAEKKNDSRTIYELTNQGRNQAYTNISGRAATNNYRNQNQVYTNINGRVVTNNYRNQNQVYTNINGRVVTNNYRNQNQAYTNINSRMITNNYRNQNQVYTNINSRMITNNYRNQNQVYTNIEGRVITNNYINQNRDYNIEGEALTDDYGNQSDGRIIIDDIDFSVYKERGYDLTMDILPRYYTVRKGDTLRKISSYHFIYQDPEFYNIIYNANKDKIRNQSGLTVGERLIIPSIRGETRYWTYEPLLEYISFKSLMDLPGLLHKNYPFMIRTKE
ncbi:LysM peptidoglycan-binding domain-containing protein [uncultured Brachyspira sp.]|uniref:LysM peptidoglycan-binding domain-containing protein n=2 Tax=uncultured Brachyspira sp. TaxID=221953 RepID=UPI00261231B7|nr:LysM peptidoglycan-binding domain-containing protein [uncultured Brachyspira sp.]